MNQTTESKGPPLIVFQLIWLAMVGSLFLFVFIAKTNGQSRGVPLTWTWPNLSGKNEQTFAFMAIVEMIIAYYFPKFLWSQSFKKKSTDESLTPEKQLGKFVPGFMIRLALLESISLFGFVLALQGEPNKILPFVGASLIGMALNFPSREYLRTLA